MPKTPLKDKIIHNIVNKWCEDPDQKIFTDEKLRVSVFQPGTNCVLFYRIQIQKLCL